VNPKTLVVGCVTASVVYYSLNYEFIISSNAEMVYGVEAHGDMNFYLREISPFFPGNFNLGYYIPGSRDFLDRCGLQYWHRTEHLIGPGVSQTRSDVITSGGSCDRHTTIGSEIVAIDCCGRMGRALGVLGYSRRRCRSLGELQLLLAVGRTQIRSDPIPGVSVDTSGGYRVGIAATRSESDLGPSG
jgi:hypothetical protein